MTTPTPPAIGPIPDKATLIAMAAAIAKAMADNAVAAARLARWIESVGADGLGTAQFTTEEGTAYMAAAELMAAYGGVFLGGPPLGQALDHSKQLAQLIGPSQDS